MWTYKWFLLLHEHPASGCSCTTSVVLPSQSSHIRAIIVRLNHSTLPERAVTCLAEAVVDGRHDFRHARHAIAPQSLPVL